MNIKDDSGIDKQRLLIADNIYKVLTATITVQQALKSFPNDTEDPSIIASWHALVHYEADEELRANNIDYKEEQDSYLEMIASTFKDGQDLPLNIIKSYNEFYGSVRLNKSESFMHKLRSIFRFTV